MKISRGSLGRKSFWRSFGRGVLGFRTHSRLGYNKGVFMRPFHRGVVGTMYNQILRDIGKPRSKTAYQMLLSFTDYIMAIDPILDSPDFVHRQSKQIGLRDIKSLDVSRERASLFVKLLKNSNLSKEKKSQIVKVFSNFRRNAGEGVHKTFQDPFADYLEVAKGVNMTAGEMFGTFAELACVLHDVPRQQTIVLRDAYKTCSNALQFVDDIKDCLKDYGVQQNLLIGLAKTNSQESGVLERQSRKRSEVSIGWVCKNLPQSFARAEMEFLKLLNAIPNYSGRDSLIQFAKDAFYGF